MPTKYSMPACGSSASGAIPTRVGTSSSLSPAISLPIRLRNAPSCKRPTSPGGLCEALRFIRTRQPDTGHRCCGVAAVQLTLRPAVLQCDIAALDTVGFFETMPDRVERAGFTIGAIKQADHRHRPLLRARRERPCHRRAAECGQQFPPSDGDCHTPLPCEGCVN